MLSSGWSLRTTTHGQCKWAVQDEDQDRLGAGAGRAGYRDLKKELLNNFTKVFNFQETMEKWKKVVAVAVVALLLLVVVVAVAVTHKQR